MDRFIFNYTSKHMHKYNNTSKLSIMPNINIEELKTMNSEYEINYNEKVFRN